MFLLESPHLGVRSAYRGDSNEYTQYTILIHKKDTLNCPKSSAMGFFQGTQERVRNGRGKRSISVRATNSYKIEMTRTCNGNKAMTTHTDIPKLEST